MVDEALILARIQFPKLYDWHIVTGEVHYMLALRGKKEILDGLTGHRLLRDPVWRQQFEGSDATVRQQMSRALTGRA